MIKPKHKNYLVSIRKQLVKFLVEHEGFSLQDTSQIFNVNGTTVQAYLNEGEKLPVIKY